MELNVTKFFKAESGHTNQFMDSIANSGLRNIGKVTWENARHSDYTFVTDENLTEFVNYFAQYGAWDDLDEWSINDINALFIQELSGVIAELEHCDGWEDYQKQSEEGQVSGNLFKTGDEIYFTVSH